MGRGSDDSEHGASPEHLQATPDVAIPRRVAQAALAALAITNPLGHGLQTSAHAALGHSGQARSCRVQSGCAERRADRQPADVPKPAQPACARRRCWPDRDFGTSPGPGPPMPLSGRTVRLCGVRSVRADERGGFMQIAGRSRGRAPSGRRQRQPPLPPPRPTQAIAAAPARPPQTQGRRRRPALL